MCQKFTILQVIVAAIAKEGCKKALSGFVLLAIGSVQRENVPKNGVCIEGLESAIFRVFEAPLAKRKKFETALDLKRPVPTFSVSFTPRGSSSVG